MEGPKWHLLLLLLVFQFNLVINTKGLRESRSFFSYSDGLTIDLSLPGVTVQSSVQSILPDVSAAIQNELKIKNSVTIGFAMTMPPNQSPSYVVSAQKELIVSLKNHFPDCEISVSARPQLDNWGFLRSIAFEVSLKRGGSGSMVIIPGGKEHVIDLINSSVNVVASIRAMIINLLPKIRTDLQIKNEVTFSIVVKVPFNSNPGFLETLQSSLILQLTTYFPSYDTTLTSRTESVQGVSANIFFTVKLRRQIAPAPNPSNEILVNWIPGATTVESELTKYLPSIVSRLQATYMGGNPASFTLKIQTPRHVARPDLDKIKSQIHQVMNRYFPDAKVEIRLDGKGGPLNAVMGTVDIYPQTSIRGGSFLPPPYYKIDLKIPGVDLTNELNELFTRILPRSQMDLKKYFTFNILLIPPMITDLKYVDNIKAKMTEMIRARFPKSNILIDASIKENSWGGILNILFDIFLQLDEKEGDHFEKKLEWKKIAIDLVQPLNTLENQIQIWLQSLIPEVKNELKSGKSYTLQFEMKPGAKTRKTDLKIISSMILSIVISVFPNLRIDMKGRDVQDERGNIKYAEVRSTVHPEKRNNELGKVTLQDKFVIELNKPGSSVDSLMFQLMPEIFETIEKFKNKHTICTIPFVIRPPKGSEETYVREVSSKIIEYISKYFPEYFIEFVTNGIKDQGNIREIKLDAFLVPGKSTVDDDLITVIPPSTFSSDVPNNGKPILLIIYEWLQSNLMKIFADLMKHPVTLEFKIQPPNWSTVDYETQILEEVKELILNLFHHCNMRFGIFGITDEQGVVTQIILVVTIVPTTSNPELIETSGTETVTPLITTIPPGDRETYTSLSFTEVVPFNPSTITATVPTREPFTPTPFTEMVTPGRTFSPLPKIPPADKFPPFNITVNPDVDLEEEVRNGLSKTIIDILAKLKHSKPCLVQYYTQFPKGTNQADLHGIVETIQILFEQQFPTDIVAVTLGDTLGNSYSISSAIINIVVKPVHLPKIIIDLKHPSKIVGETIRKRFPEIERKLRFDLKKNKKPGVRLEIWKPLKESPSFLMEVIKALSDMMELSFPEFECRLDVDISVPKKVLMNSILVPKKPPANEQVEFFIDIKDGVKPLTQRIDDKLNSLYQTLQPFLYGGKKVVLIINVDLAPGSNEMSVEKIIDHLKSVLKFNLPNIAIGIMPYLKRDLNNNAYYTRLDVTLDSSVVGEPSEVHKVQQLSVDISDPKVSINEVVRKMLPQITDVLHEYSNQKEAITLAINIIPPKRSGEAFLNTVTEVLVPRITSSLCNNEKKWKINTNYDLEGFLTDVVLIITFQPSKNSGETESKECQENIEIDLSSPNSHLGVSIDRILPSIYNEISTSLEQGKNQILNFKFIPPPNSGNGYLNEISTSLKEILQKYFPYNMITIRLKAEQNTEGYLVNAQITITIEPEKNPLPPASLTIPLDVSQRGSVSYYVKTAVKKYISQIQSLREQKSSVVISFQINPPTGAKEDYFDMLGTELLEGMQELFPGVNMKAHTKGAKNSRNEFFKIIAVITLYQ